MPGGFGRWIWGLVLACATAGGQSSPAPAAPLPEAPNVQTQRPGQTDEEREAQREVDQQEQQRILKVVPNFNTVINGRGVKLSKGQKTELALHATFDPFNAVGAVVLAGASELGDTHRGYGWGPAGFAKRVGANGLDVIDGTMMAGAVYPILLHQDPRFFRQGTGTIGSRIRHALLGPFVCNGDNQRRQFNFSNVLGNFTAGAVSNLYYPKDERGFGLAAENSAIVLVEGGLGNIGLEFSPDVGAWWKRRRARVAP